MALSKYAKELGLKSKKDILAIAPKDAEWSDFSGDLFYKIEGEKVLMISAEKGDQWFQSSQLAEDITEAHFMRLKKAAPTPAPQPSAPRKGLRR